jgi:hypothetical protein
MASKSMKEKRSQRRKSQKTTRTLIWIGVGILVVIFVGFIAWRIFRPASGENIPIMANAGDHVPQDSDPGQFNSDPPTSGPHYAQEFDAGFYDESDPEAQVPYPEGYLIHNLEHGYIIFWYNCELLNEGGCTELKNQIQGVMDEFNNFKVIGFPRSSIDVPLAMTSWGQLQTFETFDAAAASNFIRSNQNRAPEPNAP